MLWVFEQGVFCFQIIYICKELNESKTQTINNEGKLQAIQMTSFFQQKNVKLILYLFF